MKMLASILIAILIQDISSAPQLTLPETQRGEKESVRLTSFHVNTTISFRYSRTEVTAQYRNPGTEADKAVFSMVLPKSAFISNFSLTIKDEEYVAEVKEKEEAKKTFDEAVASGNTAGLVSKNTRDSNQFSVDTNLEPGEKVTFTLTYEELLERQEDQYEYVLHVEPGVVLEDFHVEVNINESLPLSKLSVPELVQSNEIDLSVEESESSIAQVTRDLGGSPNNARVVFSPSKTYQLEAGDQGVSGRFVVRDDVDRRGQHSEVQLIDGYFVHYFVPSDLPTLPKHAVFVLDTSGSMGGEKIQQLKDAMFTVLEDLTDSDFFNMIEFNSDVSHWSGEGFTESSTEFYPATEENKNKAIKSVIDLSAGGGTNLNDAILAGLDVAETALQREALPKDVKSLIVFLTDGLGSTASDVIKTNIKTKNRDLQTPVFTVAFGADTDLSLLQSIASQNNAISKRIYEGSDAALQLEDFYAQISSPLLSNIKVQYVGGVDNTTVSQTGLHTFFRGTEFIISGKLSGLEEPEIGVKVSGLGEAEVAYSAQFDICLRSSATPLILPLSPPRCLQPRVFPKSEAQSFLQKLFAFQHIKQLLEKVETAETEEEKEELREKAIELSLVSNFVTDVTSLVVVKPDGQPKITGFTGFTGFTDQQVSGGISLLSYQSAAYIPKSAAYIPGHILLRSGYDYDSYSMPMLFSDLDYENIEEFAEDVVSETDVYEEVDTTNTTTKLVNEYDGICEGTLTLYSQTYHRGDQLELTSSQPDLADQQFDETAVSALVTGSCCWELYSGANYSGPVISLRPGVDYTSVTSLGQLFRDVTSVREITC